MKTIKIENALALFVVLFIVLTALLNQCQGVSNDNPVIVETDTIIKIKTDTVINTIINEVPKTVYVEKVKTIKGKDSIIYKDSPSETTITANQYETKIESNNAFADLNITTTGELLDVSGVITYPEKETTTTITNTVNSSGFYIYGSSSLQDFTPELGVLYNFKSKAIIGLGGHIDQITKDLNVVGTIAIKL